MKNKIFKFTIFLLAFAICLPLAGCSFDSSESKPQSPSSGIIRNYAGAEEEEEDVFEFANKVAFRPTSNGNIAESDAWYYEVTTQFHKVSQAILSIINAKYNLGLKIFIDDYLDKEIPDIAWLIKPDGENISLNENFSELCYDSIRYGAKETEDGFVQIDIESGWKWSVGVDYNFTFDEWNESIISYYNKFFAEELTRDENLFYLKSSFEIDGDDMVFSDIISDHIFNDANKLSNYEIYTAMYAGLLEMAMLDIAIGKQPETFNIAISEDDGMPLVGGVKLPEDARAWEEGNVGTLSVLRDEKLARYNDLSAYIGFNEKNIETLVDYIFSDVIGSKAIALRPSMYKKDELISEIRELLHTRSFGQGASEDLQDKVLSQSKSMAHSAFAKCVFADTSPADFAPLLDDEDSMKNIVAKEYTSVIFMNNGGEVVSGFLLDVESEHDMVMKIYTRYYDFETEQIFDTRDEAVEFVVNAGKLTSGLNDDEPEQGYSGIIDVPEQAYDKNNGGVYSDIELPLFDNNDRIGTGSGTRNVTSYNRVYKLVPSVYGYGSACVFDETYATSDFLEIVFDIDRQSNEEITDFSFKFAISLYFFDTNRTEF